MPKTKNLNRLPSPPSSVASHHSAAFANHRMRTRSPLSSEYEYLGRVVTRERPVVQKLNSKPSAQHHSVQNIHSHHHSRVSHRRHELEPESSYSESGDDVDDGFSKPLGVIRITDRHFREIYRIPTPPPKVKRVIHRLKSPEPKVIERIFVRRPPPEIIENIIEVPPEKVRIINREKILERSSPITRSRLIHLQAKRRRQRHLSEGEEQHGNFIPSEQYTQQNLPTPIYSSQQPIHTTESLFYAPQQNMPNVSCIQTTIPSQMLFNTQHTAASPPAMINSNPTPTPYAYQVPQQQQYYTYQQSQPQQQQYHMHQQPQQQQYYYDSQPQYYTPSAAQQMMMPNNPYRNTQF